MSIMERMHCATFLSKFCEPATVWNDITSLLLFNDDLTIDIDIEKLNANEAPLFEFISINEITHTRDS